MSIGCEGVRSAVRQILVGCILCHIQPLTSLGFVLPNRVLPKLRHRPHGVGARHASPLAPASGSFCQYHRSTTAQIQNRPWLTWATGRVRLAKLPAAGSRPRVRLAKIPSSEATGGHAWVRSAKMSDLVELEFVRPKFDPRSFRHRSRARCVMSCGRVASCHNDCRSRSRAR
jgi:hypothetical protein